MGPVVLFLGRSTRFLWLIAVLLFSGGFLEFSQLFPGLCEGKSTLVPSCISQPCLAVTSVGPTRILPHLYLGCQRDVLNKVTHTDRFWFLYCCAALLAVCSDPVQLCFRS